MTGSKYGSLIVISKKGRYCLCRCECGVLKSVRMDHLKTGATISCGCVGKRNSALAKIKHGMSETRMFKIWCGMVDRCRNDRSGNYGRRGIRVCLQWESSFEQFCADMGEPPTSKHSIDRIDVNGNYEPNNCRWATRTDQGRNKRNNTVLKFDGELKPMSEWAEKKGIKPATICVRLYSLGWSIEKALTTPVQNRKINYKPWDEIGISRSSYYRNKKGGSG